MPCSCGYQIKPALERLVPIDQVLIDGMLAFAPSAQLQIWLDPMLGRYLDAGTICTLPPPTPIEPTIEWYLKPWEHLDDILNNLIATNWNLWCECAACPPLSGCGGTNFFDITSGDGVLTDPPYDAYRYTIPGGQQYYVERLDTNGCFGPFTGLEINWCLNSAACGGININARSADGSGIQTIESHGSANPTLRIYQGSGTGGVTPPDFPIPPVTVAPPPTADTCDPTDICTAIQPIADQIEVIRLILNQIAGGQVGLAGDYVFDIPGIGGPLAGTLNETLAKAITALSPIQPSQLTNPVSTGLTAPGSIGLSGEVYVSITLDVVPAGMTAFGSEAPVYLSHIRQPGPGWVQIMTDAGLADYYPISSPSGVRFILPPDATALLVELTPGVEVTVTTYERAV